MDTRPRTRLLRRALVVTALGALVVPATADAAKQKTKLPVITKVAPKSVSVGETLVITGSNFRVGKNKNTVMFKRDGGKALFVKGGLATKRQIALVIPKSLEKYMANTAGSPVATRFRLRVLTTKLGKTFTAAKSSPVIGPEKPKVVEPPKPPTAPDADCDGDGQLNSVDIDDDNDLLSDAQETALKLNTCSGDSDTDGVEDGYEYQSAMDLNNDDYQHANYVTPFPGKTPYPNPLYADADVDYDGDGLTLDDEYKLWKYTYDVAHTAARSLALSYSDGTQYTFSQLIGGNGIRQPTMTTAAYVPAQSFRAWANATGYATVWLFEPDANLAHTRSLNDLYDFDRDGTVGQGFYQHAAEGTYWDMDGNGYVSDDERDEDVDGLNNYTEFHGPMSSQMWWVGCYPTEGKYPVPYAGTSAYDSDTDGDGILDGADDQDFDDVPNILELSRNMAGNVDFNGRCGGVGTYNASAPVKTYVNPFNPCLPDRQSRTCQRHPVIGQAYGPFTVPWEPMVAN